MELPLPQYSHLRQDPRPGLFYLYLTRSRTDNRVDGSAAQKTIPACLLNASGQPLLHCSTCPPAHPSAPLLLTVRGPAVLLVGFHIRSATRLCAELERQKEGKRGREGEGPKATHNHLHLDYHLHKHTQRPLVFCLVTELLLH